MWVSRQSVKNSSKPEQTRNCSVDRLKKRPKIGKMRPGSAAGAGARAEHRAVRAELEAMEVSAEAARAGYL